MKKAWALVWNAFADSFLRVCGSGARGKGVMKPSIIMIIAAAALSATPALAGEVDEIESILEQTAVFLHTDQVCNGVTGFAVPNNTYGFGRIDVLAAVELALEYTPVQTPKAFNDFDYFILPNPASTTLRLVSNQTFGFERVDLNIYTVSGTLWGTYRNYSGEDIDISAYPAGAYFIQVTSTQTFQVLPLIKQK